MTSRRHSPSSVGGTSLLVQRFVERAGTPAASPWETIEQLVGRLQRSTAVGQTEALEAFTLARNIIARRVDPGLSCDGYIEPLGSAYSDGFRMVLRENVVATRQRFTIAHEICHTFFYELVPEVKFSASCEADASEERICNHGAAALLIPAEDLKAHTARLPVSLHALDGLSTFYRVSLETMILRLRALKLWNCELSIWHRMTNGDFVLDRLYGFKRLEWDWTNPSVPLRAWEACDERVHSGQTFVHVELPNAHPEALRVYYQIRRRGNVLVAIWSKRKLKEIRPPLFNLRKPRAAVPRGAAAQ